MWGEREGGRKREEEKERASALDATSLSDKGEKSIEQPRVGAEGVCIEQLLYKSIEQQRAGAPSNRYTLIARTHTYLNDVGEHDIRDHLVVIFKPLLDADTFSSDPPTKIKYQISNQIYKSNIKFDI